jgi:hypothetical protein
MSAPPEVVEEDEFAVSSGDVGVVPPCCNVQVARKKTDKVSTAKRREVRWCLMAFSFLWFGKCSRKTMSIIAYDRSDFK